MLPLLTELGIFVDVGFYKYVAPLALRSALGTATGRAETKT